ncbi:DUF2905 domain-containing protein [Chelativorans sp. YIM 93263]|uniref:DUF2905 domain-containing protein n=1 Tax=Chelativorans sp. YIM 93263 TaxID=2906648 RepID=UPI0023792D4F|nr:DUF2905 domain-containing protein [Chelativorans sp. YIM 93263]
MSRFLIVLGLILVAVGILWPLIQRTGLGRLPGDLVLGRENFRVYIPITTSIIVSVVLTVVLWLLNR